MTMPERFEGRLYLSHIEVASLTPLSQADIAEMCRKRELRAMKHSKKLWMVEVDSVREWLGIGQPRTVAEEPREELLPQTREILAWLDQP